MIGAFFDIDGTLYRNSLLVEHFKKLIKFEVIDERIWLNKVKDFFYKWNTRSGDYEIYLEELVDSYVESLQGMNAKDIDFIAKKVIELSWKETYIYTRQRIEWHKKEGHKVIFISGSPDFLVSKMAEKYGVNDYSASKYALDEEGKFTGKVIPMWDSESKSREIAAYVKKYNLDMVSSYSYGDTLGDFLMLNSTGNPIAINPNKKLVDKIINTKELYNKVRVIVERKDVIYDVDLKKNID